MRSLIATLMLLLGSIALADAAELLMLEQPGCIYCKQWNEEIGVAYPKTEEGQRAPLRRVDITKPWPKDLDWVMRERLTPTFVLIDKGVEISRLRGYPGSHFFWPLLDDMLDDLQTGSSM
ncbi:MAG: transcriptional regulator [Rhodobiaceae bacterium]|nr:transcriptional regulator [Rhodobiaceae bacterium]